MQPLVRGIAREVEQVVASNPKVRDVQLDWNDPVRTLKVNVDQEKARALGLTPADVSVVTQTIMNGATVVRTIASAAPTVTYTAAQQNTDFGSVFKKMQWRTRAAMQANVAVNRITNFLKKLERLLPPAFSRWRFRSAVTANPPRTAGSFR